MNKSYLINTMFSICILFAGVNSKISFAESSQLAEKISPVIWLETEANKMLSQIDQQRTTLEQDELTLQNFLYKVAIPFWDTRLMAKGLGGIPYRKGSKELRKELEEQWKFTLIRYFLKALPYYDKQRLILDKKTNCPSSNRCWLKTKIEIAGKKGVDLDFYVRWNKSVLKKDKWQVIDLRVAGVSLLKHKRGETRAILKESGLVGLIAVLKEKNKKVLKTVLLTSIRAKY